MSDNFYDILGIDKKSDFSEIKKAYRQLSMKWHPDKNKNSPETVAKFQKISEAYETLSDEKKRHQYDVVENNPFMKMGGGTMEVPIEELFGSLFGGMGPMGMGPMGMSFGMNGMNGNMFPNSKVHMFHSNIPMNVGQSQQKPTPIIKNVSITIDKIINGCSIPIEIERWILEFGNKIFEKETIYVTIPQGIDDEIIILKDKGNVINEHVKGDIKIFVTIKNDTEFKRSGLDLIYEKNISLKEALCGFSFEITFINGKSYTLNNNKGNIISPEYKKIIPNMGLVRGDHTGNLIIIFHVAFPLELTPEQYTTLSEVL
jgi:DnaJ-class molecular chaperone